MTCVGSLLSTSALCECLCDILLREAKRLCICPLEAFHVPLVALGLGPAGKSDSTTLSTDETHKSAALDAACPHSFDYSVDLFQPCSLVCFAGRRQLPRHFPVKTALLGVENMGFNVPEKAA